MQFERDVLREDLRNWSEDLPKFERVNALAINSDSVIGFRSNSRQLPDCFDGLSNLVRRRRMSHAESQCASRFDSSQPGMGSGAQ